MVTNDTAIIDTLTNIVGTGGIDTIIDTTTTAIMIVINV
jgi:hypothetical protein